MDNREGLNYELVLASETFTDNNNGYEYGIIGWMAKERIFILLIVNGLRPKKNAKKRLTVGMQTLIILSQNNKRRK